MSEESAAVVETESTAQEGVVQPPEAAAPSRAEKEQSDVEKWRDELAVQAGIKKPAPEAETEEPQKEPGEPEGAAQASDEGTEKEAPKKSHEDANKAFRERQEKRRQQQDEMERLRAEAEQGRIYRQMLESLAGQPDQAQHEEDVEPDPRADPEAWHRWNYRQLERRIDEPRLQAEKQAQEEAYRQQQLHHAATQVAQELWTAGDEYEATEEGAGFHDRMDAYIDGLGERLEQLGQPREAAYNSLRMLLDAGVRSGQNPWVFADRAIKAMGYSWMEQGQNGSASSGAEAKPASPAAAARVAELQAAAKAPEARTADDMNSASSSGDVSIEALAKSGQMNSEVLKRKLQKQGKFSRKGILDALATMDVAIRS